MFCLAFWDNILWEIMHAYSCSSERTANISYVAVRVLLLQTDWIVLYVLQYTEEKLGQAEKTELDAHLENLIARADCTKNWTEKIFRQTEVLLQPNPSKNLHKCYTFKSFLHFAST